MGAVFAWTRSLVPSVLAHSLVNLPMTPFWQVLVLAACLVGTALFCRRGVAAVSQVFSGLSVLWCVVLAAVGAGYAVASQREAVAVYIAAVLLGLAVALEAMHRGREYNIRSASTLRR
jgi:hypothetical protein